MASSLIEELGVTWGNANRERIERLALYTLTIEEQEIRIRRMGVAPL